jgi:hypothetical protein
MAAVATDINILSRFLSLGPETAFYFGPLSLVSWSSLLEYITLKGSFGVLYLLPVNNSVRKGFFKMIDFRTATLCSADTRNLSCITPLLCPICASLSSGSESL